MSDDILPSWRPGVAREAVVTFLEATEAVARDQRVACFDNDGTLWCERPTYVQYEFFVDALRTAVLSDPTLTTVPEFATLLAGDREAVGAMGLERIAYALTRIFEGQSPEDFAAQVREFLARATHRSLGRPLRSNTYLPMRELMAELRRREFTVCIVTGGGTEFLRAVSEDVYGVPPQNVVGSLIAYDFLPTAVNGTGPGLRRTARLLAGANEGPNKVTNIQTQLGRRPIVAAGNSAGDREMLEWTTAGEGPTLALLVDHDDEQREFDYLSTGETVADSRPITHVAAREGWTVVSMAHDWRTVFESSTSDGSSDPTT